MRSRRLREKANRWANSFVLLVAIHVGFGIPLISQHQQHLHQSFGAHMIGQFAIRSYFRELHTWFFPESEATTRNRPGAFLPGVSVILTNHFSESFVTCAIGEVINL